MIFNEQIVIEGQKEAKRFFKELEPVFDKAVDRSLNAIEGEDVDEVTAAIDNLHDVIFEVRNHKIFSNAHTTTSFENYFSMAKFSAGISDAKIGVLFMRELVSCYHDASEWARRGIQWQDPASRLLVREAIQGIAAAWDGLKEEFVKISRTVDKALEE